MKAISNHLLVRLTKKTDELQLGDVTMYVDTSYETQRHARIVGDVILVPDSLYFKNLDHSGLKWDTPMEVKVGDEIILSFVEVTWSIKEGKSYEEDGHLFLYIKYDAAVVVKRKCSWIESTDEYIENKLSENMGLEVTQKRNFITENGVTYEIILLNGYLLVEQEKERYETVLYIPEGMQDKKAQTGIIRFIGTPNKAYHTEYDSKGNKVNGELPDDRFNLKVGDRIAFQQYADLALEYEMHRTFMGKDGAFVRLQRNKIYAKL